MVRAIMIAYVFIIQASKNNLQINSLINKYVLSTYYVPGII